MKSMHKLWTVKTEDEENDAEDQMLSHLTAIQDSDSSMLSTGQLRHAAFEHIAT